MLSFDLQPLRSAAQTCIFTTTCPAIPLPTIPSVTKEWDTLSLWVTKFTTSLSATM